MARKILFSGSTRYVIRVDGFLDDSFEDILQNYLRKKPLLTFQSMITTLDVQVKDQAALCGLLNELYNRHYIILSVQQVEERIN